MKLLRFEVSKTKNKKYDAVLVDCDGKTKRITFGDKRYAQYKDRVLGVYSDKDHGDELRRERYLKRHARDKDKPNTPGFYAAKYLW